MPKVDDVYRYLIKIKDNKFTKKDIKKNKKFTKSKYKDNTVNQDKDYKSIVLILESPHKDEYDGKTPVAPAQGITGIGIKKNIENVLGEVFMFDKSLFKEEEYRLIICNPVQYQTSLYMYHDKKLIDKYSTLRNQCWRAIWNNKKIKEDFEKRMKSYNPILIINACTYGLQNNITKYLKDNNYKNVFTTYHPSYWNGFNIQKQD